MTRADAVGGPEGPSLLMTATITPPAGVPQLARTDPEQRRRDYLAAFSFYLGLLGRGVGRLLFVENSAADLGDFRALAERSGRADRVELIAFRGLDHPPAYGRAYGEFKLIDHAMAHSRLIEEAGPEQSVWKVTGRYILRNLAALVRGRPERFDLYCNLRRYPRPWADMFLLAWNRRAHETFLKGLYAEFREDLLMPLVPENRFYTLILAARDRLRVVPRFRGIPDLEGHRGLDNVNYAAGRGRAKYLARLVFQRGLPWLWI